jgi:hypothetical protein
MPSELQENGLAEDVPYAFPFRYFFRDDSIEMQNDPRFFLQNIADKRLDALIGLNVVSTLMAGEAVTECFDMRKDFSIVTFNGFLQNISLTIMSFVAFANFFAVYVCVAQVYHTYRLITAGPSGYEIAASYYLNRNLAFFRHTAVKLMLLSLPLFLMSSGIRLLVKFGRDSEDAVPWSCDLPENTSDTTELDDYAGCLFEVCEDAPPEFFLSIESNETMCAANVCNLTEMDYKSFCVETCTDCSSLSPIQAAIPWLGNVTITACSVGLFWCCVGCILLWVHRLHVRVFTKNYDSARGLEVPLMNHALTSMLPARR